MGRNMGSSHRRSDMESQGNRTYTLQELCRFIIPSVLGTVIFLLPIQWQGNMTILIGIITDIMQKLLAPVITTVDGCRHCPVGSMLYCQAVPEAGLDCGK